MIIGRATSTIICNPNGRTATTITATTITTAGHYSGNNQQSTKWQSSIDQNQEVEEVEAAEVDNTEKQRKHCPSNGKNWIRTTQRRDNNNYYWWRYGYKLTSMTCLYIVDTVNPKKEAAATNTMMNRSICILHISQTMERLEVLQVNFF